jgi:HK97 gp10 family phage protein
MSYTGMNELISAMQHHSETLPGQVSLITRKSGMDGVAHAQTIVPVDTGATKNSIGMDVEEESLEAVEVILGPETDYSPELEFGTAKMAPRPFMGPAADQVEPGFTAALRAVANPIGGA